MPGVSSEQVELARGVDLLSYLQTREPHELRRTGPREYRTKTHGSLVISNGKWYWNRGGFGSRSALDFLIKVRGMGFVDAVEMILGFRASLAVSAPSVEIPEPIKYKFYAPKPVAVPKRAAAYLQRRRISGRVIMRAINAGILYESKYYNPESKYHNASVCVFAGKDESSKIVFAAMRGIDSDFKQDKAGSNKCYNFHIPAKNPLSHQLAVFESPIDALSHATLQNRDNWPVDMHRLSLGGTAQLALAAFLERNRQITRVTLHLDNDAAGITAARKIKAQLADDRRFKHIRVSVNPPRGGKDYNEVLISRIIIEREQKQLIRRKAELLL